MPRPRVFVCSRNSSLDIKPDWGIGGDLENPAVLLRNETMVEETIRCIVFCWRRQRSFLLLNPKKQFGYVVCFLLGNSPASEFYMPTFRNTMSLPTYYPPTYPPVKMGQRVPKRRHIKFRRRGITQKKAYNIKTRRKFEIKNRFDMVWEGCIARSFIQLSGSRITTPRLYRVLSRMYWPRNACSWCALVAILIPEMEEIITIGVATHRRTKCEVR
jgi:hypothetical protein